jgi:hypothetical protein
MLVGDFGLVMMALQNEVFATLNQTNQASFVLKILKGDATAEVNLEGYR